MRRPKDSVASVGLSRGTVVMLRAMCLTVFVTAVASAQQSKDSSISIGGEFRTRYENLRHPAWGQDTNDENGYLLQRYMLHADAHWKAFRIYGELKSGLENRRNGGPRVPDEDRVDVNQ